MKLRKYLPKVATTLVLGVALLALYVHFKMNYAITPVIPGRLYRSSEISPPRLALLASDHGIATVIDLRYPVLDDRPGAEGVTAAKIEASRQALATKGIRHIAVPSRQLPYDSMVDSFLAAMDNEDAYPVLIHCNHGIGRTGVYVAIYLMEYEGLSNESARNIVSRYYTLRPGGRKNFRASRSKGLWLMNYKPRQRRVTEGSSPVWPN